MFFLLATIAAEGWSVVSVFAAAATCLGTVKLGLETVKEFQALKDRNQEAK